jgi:hypothetical protein
VEEPPKKILDLNNPSVLCCGSLMSTLHDTLLGDHTSGMASFGRFEVWNGWTLRNHTNPFIEELQAA